MKATLACSLLFIGTMLKGADPLPGEIAAARARYETEIAIANKPIRDRYLAALDAIKKRAMAYKDLQLAVAADEEIKALGGTGASSSPSISQEGSLKKRLTNSTWTWIHPGSEVAFLSDGKAKIENSTIYSWEVTSSAKRTVEVKWPSRSATFTFSEDLKSAKALMDGERQWDSKPVVK